MSTTHPQDIFETGQNHLKPFLAAVVIFVVCVVVSMALAGRLP